MSTNETQEAMEMGTKPVKEHEWLKNLVGNWRTETEMSMAPDQPKMKSTGTETVQDLGGLWSFGEGKSNMPDGSGMEYKVALGYDVSFKEYRGCWFASMSSHLWKYTGTLSADGKVMTLNCVGPSMEKDGETANYRDVITIIDENRRSLSSSGQQENGDWMEFMTVQYYRV
ncbi:MAG: DUF1579 domain-containing protein [Armatimonadota bacterium]|nr:DUF1579 domain-containing protein [Armatimonadota bacterium]